MVIPEYLQDLLTEAEYPSEDGRPSAEIEARLRPLETGTPPQNDSV